MPTARHLSLLLMAFFATARVASVAAQTPPWTPLPDGTPDPRFGTAGIAVTIGAGAALQPDGKFIVRGIVTGSGFARYQVDGSLDETFNPDEDFVRPGSPAVAFAPDGRRVTSGGCPAMCRSRPTLMVTGRPS